MSLGNILGTATISCNGFHAFEKTHGKKWVAFLAAKGALQIGGASSSSPVVGGAILCKACC